MNHAQAEWFCETFAKLVANVELAMVGVTRTCELALVCLLSDGHLLLEDLPGSGKTLLAKSIANTVQGTSSRIQFTPDLHPSDITGVTIYNQQNGSFEFHKGPVFASIVLADEINRAAPRTQAALLEVMEEGRITVDGVGYSVGRPFMVIGTQNPVDSVGTFRLPAAELDRFMMCLSLGSLSRSALSALLSEAHSQERSQAVAALITSQAVVDMSALSLGVEVPASVVALVAELSELLQPVNFAELRMGPSPRASLALLRAAKTLAASKGLTTVRVRDVEDLVVPVLAHRLVLDPEAEFAGTSGVSVLHRALTMVTPPK